MLYDLFGLVKQAEVFSRTTRPMYILQDSDFLQDLRLGSVPKGHLSPDTPYKAPIIWQ